MSGETPLPSEEQQRAKWDLLLLDLEHRAEQLTQLKTVDLGLHIEQLRQLKMVEPWKLASAGMTSGAALLAAGAAIGACIAKLWGGQ